MSAVRTQEQMDADLEADIDNAYERMVRGATEEAKRTGWSDMAVLIRRRSTQQVMKLELERRLRK